MPQSSIDPIVAENLRAALQRKNQTAYSVATAIGRAPNWLYRVINQDAGILLPTLREVADHLDIPMSELVDRPINGSVHRSDPPQASANVDVDAFAPTDDDTVVHAEPIGFEWFKRRGLSTTHSFFMIVRGNSMEPTLPDGCSIIVDSSRKTLRNGYIFVMRIDGALMVKRVMRYPEGWSFLSDNPVWAPIPLGDDVTIVGEVRWVGMALTRYVPAENRKPRRRR